MLGFISPTFAQEVKITNLKVENTFQPLGLDIEVPRFSWQMAVDGDKRAYSQKAYQIIVKDEKQKEVWNSGKVSNNESLNIYYKGEPLKPTTRYTWNLSVWDQTGKVSTSSSSFETGFLNSSINAWSGAQWIGGTDDDLVLQSDYQSVFRLSYDLQLDKKSKSTKASFVVGANDPRLMDKYKNIYGLENARDESYILLTLDISSLLANAQSEAKLDVYRVGYHQNDKKEVPIFSFNIPSNIINKENMYQSHTIEMEMIYGLFDIFIDGKTEGNKITKSDSGNLFNAFKTFNLNPVGTGGDYTSFPVLADIGFKTDNKQIAYFSDITVANYREPSNTLFQEKITNDVYQGIYSRLLNDNLQISNGKFKVGGDKPTFIVADPSRNSVPMLRTTFNADKAISKARLYVTARGIYEMYLNGERIGKDYFSPGLTQYNKTHLYQTYDVTSQIKVGGNAIGAYLSEGWWSGPSTFIGTSWNYFGDRQSLLAKLVITYQDGTEKTIVTDDNWKYYADGPIRMGSFFQGEVYDARKEAAVNGWNTSRYNDSQWKQAKIHQGDGMHQTTDYDKKLSFADLDGYDKTNLIGTTIENPQIVRTLTAQSVKEASPGVFIYDMGQNMVGVPEITVTGKNGDEVVLRYAEVLYPDLPEYKDTKGLLMTENLRAAMVRDIYILKGGKEIIAPRFTFHGYRYLEITGIKEALPLSDVKGKVISSIHELTSDYKTSNADVNRLWNNITWSSLGNFISIPTDCPQRNERMGWSGDISVFAKTATYVGNLNAFLNQHLLALRDTQRKDGRYSDVAPIGAGFGGILWGSAGIIIPWEIYNQYGDVEALRKHYQSMKQYLDFFASTIDPQTNVSSDGQLGDWLSPVNNMNDNTLLFEAYYIYELEIMSKVANVLGYNDDSVDYKKLHDKRKEYFNNTYLDVQKRTVCSGNVPLIFGKIDPDNYKKGKLMDTQVSYAVPLALNVINEKDRAAFAENFAQTLRRKNKDDSGVIRPEYSLLTGFIGTSWISSALSETGYDAEAYRLLLNDQYPSWLYPVKQGSTTIWERLNSYTEDNGFGGNNSMNSFNHYSFGAVGAWMINYSLGIQRDENHPGFKHFILKPVADPDKKMKFAEGYYDSYYGRIESKWSYSDDMQKITYMFSIPANTSATLQLPAKGKVIMPKNKTGIEEVKNSNNNQKVYELKSGNYIFVQEL